MRGPGRGLGAGILALGLAALGGCSTITYDAAISPGAIAMNRGGAMPAYEHVGSFETQRRAVFVILSLITVVDSELEDVVRRELARAGGDAVINLRIHEENDIIDAVIAVAQSILLLGGRIVDTRTITIRGDVVRWTGTAGSAELEVPIEGCRTIALVPEAGAGRDGEKAGLICGAG